MHGLYHRDMAEDTQAKESESRPEPMDSIEIQVVNYVEQTWNLTGNFPSEKAIFDRYPKFNLAQSMGKSTFVNAVLNRGIEFPSPSDELTVEQVAAISAVMNFDDTRSRAAKLKELGISHNKWQGWMKNLKFKGYLQKVSADAFEGSLHVAHEGLLRAVDRGSVDAVKFFMELTGRHSSSSVEQQNVRVILAKVMESIQKNVRDPEVIRAIAYDFERILRGELVPEPAQIERSI